MGGRSAINGNLDEKRDLIDIPLWKRRERKKRWARVVLWTSKMELEIIYQQGVLCFLALLPTSGGSELCKHQGSVNKGRPIYLDFLKRDVAYFLKISFVFNCSVLKYFSSLFGINKNEFIKISWNASKK